LFSTGRGDLMLRLILGRAGSGKTSRIMREIKHCGESGEKRLCLVVPDQYSHNAERLLCEVCGNALSLYGEVLTFRRFASRVFDEVGGICGSVVDKSGRMLIMSRALETAMPDLRVFCRRTGNSAFIADLVETASEFKNACITVSDIEAVSKKAAYPLDDKLHDLALIYDIYWSYFDVSHLDPDDLLTRAAELLPDSSYADGVSIWLDGFDDFSALQLDFIGALLANGADVTVPLTCDGLAGDSDVFGLTRSTAAQLIALAQRLGVQYDTEHMRRISDEHASCFDALENMLVSGISCSCEAACDGKISLFTAKTPAEECECAAASILSLVKSGYRWQDISVVTGSWEQYRAIGKSIFAKYGIPVYMTEKTDILMLPPASLISSAICTVVSGWEYSHIFRYLKTGLCDITREECDLLENYVLKWGIRGQMWYREEDWDLSPDGYESSSSEQDAGLLERLNDIRRRVAGPLLAFQEALQSADTAAEKLRALYAFLVSGSLPEKLKRRSEEYDISGDMQLSRVYSQIWDTFVDVMEQFNDAAGDMRCELTEFLRLWELALTQYNIGTIPSALDMVSFGDMERVRRRGTRCMIVIGATDDVLPHITETSGVFSDFEREELISSGLALHISPTDRILRDLFALYASLTLPDEHLIMTCPENDHSGTEKRPAPVMLQIAQLFSLPVERVDISACRLTARIPCFEHAIAARSGAHNSQLAARLCRYDTSMSQKLDAAQNAASMQRGVMSEQSARRLYGENIHMTASRVDKYYSCRYSYFLRYGLKIKPRRKAELDPSIIGSFMHYVLENVTRDIKAEGGFRAVADDRCIRLSEKYVSQYAQDVLQGVDNKSGRFKYLFEKLAKDVSQIVLEMASELRRSDFEPLDFELDFSNSGELPPPELCDGDTHVEVSGFVDRVDGWLHDGKLYLRVIDYKTGRKTFSLSEVWNGLGLQMLIYLFALGRSGSERYGSEIVPAGVVYVPARDMLVSVPRSASDSEIAKKRAEQIMRSGLILDEPEVIEAMENGDSKRYIPVRIGKTGEFSGSSLVTAERLGRLSKHIDKLLIQVGRELRSGYLAADPYYRSPQEDACRVCDYRQACAFGTCPGDDRRHVTRLKTPEVWDLLEKEARK